MVCFKEEPRDKGVKFPPKFLQYFLLPRIITSTSDSHLLYKKCVELTVVKISLVGRKNEEFTMSAIKDIICGDSDYSPGFR